MRDRSLLKSLELLGIDRSLKLEQSCVALSALLEILGEVTVDLRS